MKKTVILFLISIFLFSSCTYSFGEKGGYLREYPETVFQKEPEGISEYRAVWFSYLDYEKHLSNKNEAEFAPAVREVFKKISDFGFNTVIFQILPFSAAYYKSEIYPSFTSEFDPLKIAIEAARENGLKIEGWINPFRAFTVSEAEGVSANSYFGRWYQDETTKGKFISLVSGRWYYNPAYSEVREMLFSAVREIVSNYELDGIHIDDYFYPTTDPSFDAFAFESLSGGKSLGDFRRDNINKVVSGLYSAIKETNPSVSFGISPIGNIEKGYSDLYADVALWAREGYADYILPQIYYSFKQTFYSYTYALDKWKALEWNKKTKLYVGLAAYKLSGRASYFTKEEEEDWKTNSDMLSRQVSLAREVENFGGFAVFSYSDFFPEDDIVISKEKENLRALF